MSKCPHDSSKLEAYDDSNPEKAGRVFCAECGCSFRDDELATRGAECPFFAPTPAETVEAVAEVAAEPEVAAESVAEEPEETAEEAPRRRGR